MESKIKMKFYKTEDDKLFQFNPETKIYKLRNTVELIDPRISDDEFKVLATREIKNAEFSRLMNVYFKDVKHSWRYNYNNYRKLPNFEAEGHSFSSNYKLGEDVPYHDLSNGNIWSYLSRLVLVYHWGRIYYHTVSYGGYPQGQLINPITMDVVRWARLKHCAPVFNEDIKKIC